MRKELFGCQNPQTAVSGMCLFCQCIRGNEILCEKGAEPCDGPILRF